MTGAPVRFPEIRLVESGQPTTELLSISVEEPGLCRRFVARWLSGVQVGPSPDVVQVRLQAAGMRPISNVVDASNYVMLELGKPTHTFDAAAVRDHRLVVRRARAGSASRRSTTSSASSWPRTWSWPIRPARWRSPGSSAARAARCRRGPTAVIIESAIFDPVAIRRTGQRYALRSEASLRFEKGQEFRLARIGADRVAGLIAEWAGASVAAGRADSAAGEPGPTQVAFRPARVDRLLGTELGPDEQRAILARAGIATEAPTGPVTIPIAAEVKPLTATAGPGEALVAVIPTWRADLEIESDLAEEVARVLGYEQIPPILPHTAMPPYLDSPLGVRDLVRETLAGAGLTEVVTAALVARPDRSRPSDRRPRPDRPCPGTIRPRDGRSGRSTPSPRSTRSCARSSSAACSRSSP